jgi:hypothetical protein
MALGDINISMSGIRAEMGGGPAGQYTLSELSTSSNINKFSRYAPGALGVDANKNVTLTPPPNTYKIGEFRRYNHSSSGPTIQAVPTQFHPEGTNTINLSIDIVMGEFNLMQLPTNGIDGLNRYFLTVKVFSTAANRTSDILAIQQFTGIPTAMIADTDILSGHSRQSTYIMNSGTNTLTLNNFDCNYLSATRYVDIFFSDSVGNRVANFGGSRSSGFVDVVCVELTQPRLTIDSSVPILPSGKFGAIFEMYTTNVPCLNINAIPVVYGSNTYSAYLGVSSTAPLPKQAYSGTGTLWMRRSDGIYGTEDKQLGMISFSSTGKTLVSGTLSGWAKGNTWYYNELGMFYLSSLTWGSGGTTC